MVKNIIIGIDVSKEKINLCISKNKIIKKEVEVTNTNKEIKNFFEKIIKENKKEEILVCCEYTGHYNYPLCCACEELKIDLWLENPYQIKHSNGLQRGKNDKVDAKRIMEYATRFQDKIKLFTIPDKNIASLKILIAERDMYIADKRKYKAQLTDQERFMSKKDYDNKSKRLKKLINELEECIAIIDKSIKDFIDSDDMLSKQHKLLCTIDGIGTTVATKMIVETNAFKDFDNARKFSCHAGVAPIEYTSGSSVRSKKKVSQKADKSIKALLHMAAMAVATKKKTGELREYYLRKIAEGKNKMLILNAIREKLITRMFAVIRDNRIYEQNYKIALCS